MNGPSVTPNNTVDFYGRDFFITPDVLRPRPETEGLVDAVKILAGLPILLGVKPTDRILPENPVILDVGTGSGVLAITLALELAPLNPHVLASDISEKALEIAKKNAKNLSAPVTFFHSDLLANLSDTLAGLPATPSKPDLIVANLPYVDHTWPWLSPTLGKDPKEPDLALFAEDHGLALIKHLILQAAAQKVPHLILEADPSQLPTLTAFAADNHYATKKAEGFVLSLSYC